MYKLARTRTYPSVGQQVESKGLFVREHPLTVRTLQHPHDVRGVVLMLHHLDPQKKIIHTRQLDPDPNYWAVSEKESRIRIQF